MSDQAPAPEATHQGTPPLPLAPPNSSAPPHILTKGDLVEVISGIHRKTNGRIGDKNGNTGEVWVIVAGNGEISFHPRELRFVRKSGPTIIRE